PAPRASVARGRRPPGLRACPRAPDVASRLPQAPARARGRRAHRADERGAGGELRALRRAHERSRRVDGALREVLDREARFARPLSLPAGGTADMEQAKLREKPSLTLTRSYRVAPEKVWRAWTDAQAGKKWWGTGSNEPVSLAGLDPRVGGRLRVL